MRSHWIARRRSKPVPMYTTSYTYPTHYTTPLRSLTVSTSRQTTNRCNATVQRKSVEHSKTHLLPKYSPLSISFISVLPLTNPAMGCRIVFPNRQASPLYTYTHAHTQ